MIKKPFFSIVIPTYNRALDLQLALYCILRQSFSDFEIIVSDNCSTDNTRDVVSKFKDKKIRYLRNKKNIGVIPNIKKTIKYAKGEYVFLHSDDDFLLEKNSLKEIFIKIKKYNPGYIRVNYVCLMPDKKLIFDFKINKSFTKDEYLPSFSVNKKILSFILDSDASFVTGIIFKNKLTNDITIINCEPMSWIEILFYETKNYGAYFISKPYIIASWSQWRIRDNGHYQQYAVINGKLESENYFNVVKKYLDSKAYKMFLRNQLTEIYVRWFPIVKFYIGNKNMLQLVFRIRSLDPNITRTTTFWVYLIFALILPKICIKIIKNVYIIIYTSFSKIENSAQIIARLRRVNKEYSHHVKIYEN